MTKELFAEVIRRENIRNSVDFQRQAIAQYAKADHDRKRYKKRIKFLDDRHTVLCAQFHALEKENEILRTSVYLLERRLLDEPSAEKGAAESAEASAEKAASV